MDGITKNDVMRLHTKLSEIPYAANRCLSVISSLWNWAAERGERAVTAQNNPAKVKRSSRYAEQAKERFLSPEELGSLGDALRRAETVGLSWTVDETNPKAKHARKNRIRLIDKHAVAALRLLILTGARLREILNAKWEYIDFERGMMLLPDSKSAIVNGIRRAKAIYLSAAALTVLNGIQRVAGNPYVFPGESRKGKNGQPKKREPQPRADLKRPWQAIARASGFVEMVQDTDKSGKPIFAKGGEPKLVERFTVRIHDLRHSFASVGTGASLGLPIIGKLLGHKNAATTARYSHLDADPARHAADIIGGQIDAAMGGKSAEVVTLKTGSR
jgi:integrase